MDKKFITNKKFAVNGISIDTNGKEHGAYLEIYHHNGKIVLSVSRLKDGMISFTFSDKEHYFILCEMPRFAPKKFKAIAENFSDAELQKYMDNFLRINYFEKSGEI